MFPGYAQSRSISGNSGQDYQDQPANQAPNPKPQNPGAKPSLAAITPADMNKFLSTRAISEQLRIPALGRPIRLGAMYYGDDDRVAYDENLWRDSTLKNNASVAETPSSSFKIAESRDILQKYNLFNIQGRVKLSLLDGRIAVSFEHQLVQLYNKVL